MSDNNNHLFPDLDSFANNSVPSFSLINPSMHFIETNRILPGILTMNGIDAKLNPPPIQPEQQISIQANIPGNKLVGQNDRQFTIKKKKQGCTCKKTQCLKMYCDCFSNNKQCSETCQCSNCYNDGKHEQLVEKAREEIKNKGARGRLQTGCHCKKTQCIKKYCECFNAGMKCSSTCKCTSCQNMSQKEEKEENIKEEFVKI